MILYNHFYILFTKNNNLIFVKTIVISFGPILTMWFNLLDILLLISQCYIYTLRESEGSKIKFTVIMVA